MHQQAHSSPDPHPPTYTNQFITNHPSHSQDSGNIAETMTLKTMLDHIDRILNIQSISLSKHNEPQAKKLNTNLFGREKYKELLNWHQKCLADIKMQVKESQITLYSSIQQQHSILLATMHKLCEQFAKQCEQKGLLVKVLTMQHFYLHQSLTEYIDNRLRANLTERVFTQSKMEQEFTEQTRLLKEELESIKEGKDKKWRNLFMLIKDNRILRRTKGKLMRELQGALYREQQYKENIIELTKENERFKLLSHSSVYEEDGLQKWLKNLSSLIKIERYIQKQPSKAKRILEFQLENLQIDEMEALPQKIDYVIKAIEEAQELVDYYEDLNDLIAPCKLLLNNYTQTQVPSESIGINTPIVKYLNAYAQARPGQMLSNRCKLVSGVCKFTNFIEDKYLSKINNRKRDSILSTENHFHGNNSGRDKRKHTSAIMKIVDEKIVPKFAIVNQRNPNYVYKDSKFGFKLELREKQVEVKINGLLGFLNSGHQSVVNSRSKSKQKISQKRYTQQGRQISAIAQQLLSSKVEKNLKQYSKASSSLAEDNQFNLGPLWVNKKNKRYSYNSRILPLQRKFSKFNNIEGLSMSGSQLCNPTSQRVEPEPKLTCFQQLRPCLPSQQEDKPDSSLQISQQILSSSKNNGDKVVENKSQQESQSRIGRQSEGPIKSKKLEKTMEKIKTITRGTGKMTSGKNMQPLNLSGFGKMNRNSRSSQLSNISSMSRSEQYSGSGMIKKIPSLQQKSALTKKSSQKLIHSTTLDDNIIQQNSTTSVKPQVENQITVTPPKDTSLNRTQSDPPFTNTSIVNCVNPKTTRSRQYPDRNCSNYSIKVRTSYRVAPIVEQDILEENNLYEDQSARQKQLLSEEPLIRKYNPVEPDSETLQVDTQKIILKVLHLLFINRNELKHSQKTLREYMETNLRNIYGLTPQSQFSSFNKSLAFSSDPGFYALSFMRLLNYGTPIAYQNDLLKLYLILIDKCGNQSLICDMEKASKIIEYVTGLFYNEATLEEVKRETLSTLTILSINSITSSKSHQSNNHLNRITNLPINLNNYFLILETDLRKFCLKTQFYEFCQQILPQNETDLNYQQFSQITKFLPQNTRLSIHLSRLKLYFSTDKPKSHSKATMGMKIHKISLYCSRQNWTEIKDICQTIEENFEEIMDSKLCLEELTDIFNKLDKMQFGQCKAKSVCPWVYSLVKNQVKKYKEFGDNLSKNLLKLIWLIQFNLRVQSFEFLGNNLGMLGKESRRVIVNRQLGRFIGKPKQQKNEGKSEKKQKENETSLTQIKYLGVQSSNLLKSSKTINNSDRKCG